MKANREHSPQAESGPHPATHTPPACTIKVLETVDELIESYRLRYEVYGALGYVKRFNAARLEIDSFDPYSIPFGAFDSLSGEMIGTLRLITGGLQPDYARAVSRVLADVDDEDLTLEAEKPRPALLYPSIVSDEIRRAIDAYNTGGFAVRELSRTIVRPAHRGSGVSRGLMELGLAHASLYGPSVLIGGCLPEHVPMYARYGYVQLDQTGFDYYDSVGQMANAVVCRTDVLPQPTRAHVDELRRQIQSGGDECTLEIGHGAYALYRFNPARAGERRLRGHLEGNC